MMPFISGSTEGPKTRWQYELERCSKSSLIYLLELDLGIRDLMHGGTNHTMLLTDVHEAKKFGHFANINHRMRRMIDDPEGEYESYERRRRSAKAAANRRKKKARQAAKEAR